MHFSLALQPNSVIILNAVAISKVSKVISKQGNDPQLWKHNVGYNRSAISKACFHITQRGGSEQQISPQVRSQPL